MMIPVTKANYKVKRPEDLVPTLRKAYATAMSGRRGGPVAVDIPSDISMSQVEYTAYRYEGAKFPEVPDVSEAVGALRSSQRPVILAGGGAKAEGCRELILELSRRIGAPVVTTVMGGKGGAVPEDYELALGITGIHGRGSSRYVLNRSDFVMALGGARFSDRTTAKMDEFIPSRTVVHVVNDEAEIGKRKKDVIGIRADIVDFLREFLKYVGENERREAWVQEVRKVREFCRCDFNFMSEPMKPQKLIHAMNSVLPEDAILVADVGQHQMFAAHYFEARGGTRKFITSGGMGTMGYALPAAIGAKIGRPDKPVVALIGDGGFMMTVSELATAVEEDVAVKAVVMNNASLGMIRQFQAHFYGNVIYAADYSKAPNFAKIAEGFGVQSSTVERPSEMEDALREMLAYRGPYVLEVRTDREEECLPMTPPWGGKADIIYGRCRWKEVENGEVAGFSQ